MSYIYIYICIYLEVEIFSNYMISFYTSYCIQGSKFGLSQPAPLWDRRALNKPFSGEATPKLTEIA